MPRPAVPAPARTFSSPPDVRAFEDEIVRYFATLAGTFGLPRSHGEIYGLLFGSTQPLSFTDIVARLDLSKAAVSLGLPALRDIGAGSISWPKPA